MILCGGPSFRKAIQNLYQLHSIVTGEQACKWLRVCCLPDTHLMYMDRPLPISGVEVIWWILMIEWKGLCLMVGDMILSLYSMNAEFRNLKLLFDVDFWCYVMWVALFWCGFQKSGEQMKNIWVVTKICILTSKQMCTLQSLILFIPSSLLLYKCTFSVCSFNGTGWSELLYSELWYHTQVFGVCNPKEFGWLM